jgi:hypothetical protein
VQLAQDPLQDIDVAVGQARPQPLVKGDRGAGELAEERLARLGQLDVMDAAVNRVPAAG